MNALYRNYIDKWVASEIANSAVRRVYEQLNALYIETLEKMAEENGMRKRVMNVKDVPYRYEWKFKGSQYWFQFSHLNVRRPTDDEYGGTPWVSMETGERGVGDGLNYIQVDQDRLFLLAFVNGKMPAKDYVKWHNARSAHKDVLRKQYDRLIAFVNSVSAKVEELLNDESYDYENDVSEETE